MLKFITKTMCLTLIAVLFSWSANAQELVAKKTNIIKGSNLIERASKDRAGCNPVTHFVAAAENRDAVLTWNVPTPPQQMGWITYSGDECASTIGSSGGFNRYIAARFTVGDLTEVGGAKLTKFSYCVVENPSTTPQTLYVWQGGDVTGPGTQVFSYDVTEADFGEEGGWIEIPITTTITIDNTQELWIGAHINAAANVYAAPGDEGPALDGFGDLMSETLKGFSSLHASNPTLDLNWCLGVYGENAKGEPITIKRSNRAAVTGYKIFCNEELIATEPASATSYKDLDKDLGAYRYCISATYSDDCESAQSCGDVRIVDCNAPQNLELSQQEGVKRVTIAWEAPVIQQELPLAWCGTSTGYNYGNANAPSTTRIGARWESDDLAAVGDEGIDGWNIIKFRFYPAMKNSCTYTFTIYTGGSATNPGTELYAQAVAAEDMTNGWNDIWLNSPVAVDASTELWITVTAVTTVGGRSLVTDGTTTPAVGKGDLLFQNGAWVAATQMSGMPPDLGNWLISAIVEEPLSEKNIELGGTRAAIKNYIIYRDGVEIRKNAATVTSYTDQKVEFDQTYNYCVTARYENNCESPIDALCDTITVKDHPAAVNELVNNVSIYPNPASSSVTISGAEVSKVEIYNTVGQRVEELKGNVTTIDVSSYNTGIYFFKVYDANNNSVTKRIMVSR